ncbi:hypothetical protein [Streptomyces omiyaensis]|uniref:hypothetical protein n=1 Tax=Streptomyces omiyaensis TaxID=68247 RepID=UPI001E4405B7|nr:hypothetical protein [Streptomyces omiyaensis]
MNTHADQQPPMPAPSAQPAPSGASPCHVRRQLARAFTTALTHPDPATRERAGERARGWQDVPAGMASGTLRIGSRTPVTELPAWVTPEVLHGGFATGSARAGGPLREFEREAAHRAGVPAERAAVFAHHLTEPGLAALWELLDSGRYEVGLPEEAALLTVAWLVRAGETDAAVGLVGSLRPFADRLCFLPRPTGRPSATGGAERPADLPVPEPGAVHRSTVGQARETLTARGPKRAVEAQREALGVWRPFADELLRHWLELTGPEGVVRPGVAPEGAWTARGRALLDRYERLLAAHPLTGRHRRPGSNEGILRGALAELVSGRELDARRAGLVRVAVTGMVRKRGLPGSERHAALRGGQAARAALPAHHTLAHLVAERLAGLPQEAGVVDAAPFVAPVTAAEERRTGVPEGAEVPPSVRRVVDGARSAPLGVLVASGIVPSAEAMAELVPRLVAAERTAVYRDPELRVLMAANYRAFRNRRSLLLLHLARQVAPEELPWVRAVSGHARGDATTRGSAAAAARTLAETAVEHFPGTLLPNPLVRELGALLDASGLDAPLTEELAADIFMGRFSGKFLASAGIAAELLGGGSLYERYYGIDYAELGALAARRAGPFPGGDGRGRGTGRREARRQEADALAEFARLCRTRAGRPGGHDSVAGNGMVIEQAQILTTHNLATLVRRVGIAPEPGWAEAARRCFGTVCRLTERARRAPYPLRGLKDAAYAWRQMVFHLSLCGEAERDRVLEWLPARAARRAPVASRLAPALLGLRHVAEGGLFDAAGTARAGRARRLTGWTVSEHWLRPDPWK